MIFFEEHAPKMKVLESTFMPNVHDTLRITCTTNENACRWQHFHAKYKEMSKEEQTFSMKMSPKIREFFGRENFFTEIFLMANQ
ncbi:hypothetical protein MSVAZ_1573 [Methanosarcina vacuolata Z-761]|uniref:Uncharacterized protein n=1 Tax=Methanosarcina vacuolata Z-761 TaxID=1434123 RepID=A0A0E3Q5V5_9EURY|nr:hypothetical protein MSVAZ_1573 [Methanosarcina vacuolata Z-761]